MEHRTIRQLAEGALIELEKQHYSGISIKHYRAAFARFEKYAIKSGKNILSKELTKCYLIDIFGWNMDSKVKKSAHIQNHFRAIRVLECYETNGNIPGRPSQTKEPPTCFHSDYSLYISECTERGLSDETINTRKDDIYNLLVYAKNYGFDQVAEINKEFLDEYLSVCSKKNPGSMSRVLSSLRCFFRSMFSNNVILYDLSLHIPSASRYPTKRVQRIWTKEEINVFLRSVTRSDSRGKRDFALLLLIVRYGMRVGDIVNLKMTDIDWDSMSLRFYQGKTSVINVLPITNDVGWALADWIANARPKQASTSHVFTRLTAPYCEMRSLDAVFKSCMANAGIARSNYGKNGPHSLRHALASNLLVGNVPLPVITAILGHSTSTSTSVYLHADIEGLRQCALDAMEDGDE